MKPVVKILCTVLCVVMLVSMLTACGAKKKETSEPMPTPIIIYVTPEPAATPEAQPASGEPAGVTPVPAQVTPVPTAVPTPAPTAAPTATPPLTAEADESANPSLITTSQVYVGGKLQKEYNRAAKEVIRMPVADEYTKALISMI